MNYPEPKKNDIISKKEIIIKVIKVVGNNFKAKVITINNPWYEKYLTVGKIYTFSRWNSTSNVYFVPDDEVNKDCDGCAQVLLYSWEEGYSFEIDS